MARQAGNKGEVAKCAQGPPPPPLCASSPVFFFSYEILDAIWFLPHSTYVAHHVPEGAGGGRGEEAISFSPVRLGYAARGTVAVSFSFDVAALFSISSLFLTPAIQR